ncbi:polysaccharide deacetylase family protein [Aureibaculum sp. 2210JD6-5]|uniref:polysaccharide deacetylase family protein n=1 Tax=Aureibaculum sp. 2210JD6-5 TaxID=3103957 RepID=UPI002AAEC712|nr:polysaccharide deacetylase family protein [Aureibaculum sp. 2210JD6-5]MDY7393866.1 polysaccharide deacetylase family protein [Aureibaculum sp. 2210JD6-5]
MLKFGRVNSFFFVLVLLVFTFQFPKYLYIFIFLCWLIVTTIGSFHIRWNYHVNALHSNPKTNKKQVAITFDDGPNPQFTLPILAILKKHNINATFFCIGKNIEEHPELFKQIANDGHIVGNHSYSHSNNFGFFSSNKVINEINTTNKLILKISNLNCNLFRPPFGVTNPAIKNAIKKTKHHVIGWSVRSLDTKIKEPREILKRITKNLKAGDVILLHDTNKRTVVVLEQLLLFLQEHQFEAVTVDKLFEIEAYV